MSPRTGLQLIVEDATRRHLELLTDERNDLLLLVIWLTPMTQSELQEFEFRVRWIPEQEAKATSGNRDKEWSAPVVQCLSNARITERFWMLRKRAILGPGER